MFEQGHIRISTAPLHTVHALNLDIPKGRLVAVTGVSGSGKTTLILESLIPALQASCGGTRLPDHVKAADAPGIRRVSLIDSTPVGINVRSTVATYSGVLDELRKLYAATPEAKEQGCRVSDFSYNTGSLRCAGCEGTGQITMDVQFLPDVEIVCPDCGGSRYGKEAAAFRSHGISLPELMGMTVEQALERFCDVRKVRERLQVLADLGLASEIGKAQDDAVFVFDEPTIGLHPLDVRVLIGVFQKFIDAGATIIVIEHDLDMIANADYVVDMGPGGGDAGGRIVAAGTPEEISRSEESLTGKYLKKIMK